MVDIGNCVLKTLYAVLATAGLGLSLFANYFCQLVAYQPSAENSNLPTYNFGIFRYVRVVAISVDFNTAESELQMASEAECIDYPDDFNFFNRVENAGDEDGGDALDTLWIVAGSMAIVSTILGAIGCISLVLAICFSMCGSGRCWGTLCFLFSIVLPICQGLTFLILRSNICTDNPMLNLMNQINLYEENCQLYLGSYLSMGAIVIWVITGTIMGICG